MIFFSKNLRYLRKKNRWSQDILAEKLGASRNVISAYEIRNVSPKFPLLKQIAELFGKTIDEITTVDLKLKENELVSVDIDKHPDNSTFQRNDSSEIKRLKEILLLKEELLKSKESEIDALRQLIPSNHGESTTLSIAQKEDAGVFLNQRTIEIPSDKYVEVAPGVLDRTIKNEADLILDWEKVFLPSLNGIDFTNTTVLANRSKKGSVFGTAYHVEEKKLICIEGRFKECIQDKIISKGNEIKIDSFQSHKVEFLEDSVLLITLK